MMRWLSLTLLLAGCTIGSRYYVVDAVLPDGDAAGEGFFVPWFGHSVVLSVAGLDLNVVGGSDRLATWFSPWPLPPMIPVPEDAWDHPDEVKVVLTFHPRRSGWTLSPANLRVRLSDGREASASRWQGPIRFGMRGLPPPAETHESSEALIADASMTIMVSFPLASPLEGDAELELGGLALDGRSVELPSLGLRPRYTEQGDTVP
jgi:hypothetical protein